MSLSHSPHEPGELECDPGKGQPSGRGGQGSYACALSRQSGLGATGMCVCMLLVGCHTKWFIIFPAILALVILNIVRCVRIPLELHMDISWS